MAYIQFLGAAGTVTGSKHLINTSFDDDGKKGIQVLIDCGLFQGQKEWRERNWKELPIPAAEIDAVILTHAHLDHCGWIPRLVKEGFKGPIYATARRRSICAASSCLIRVTFRKKMRLSITRSRNRNTVLLCRFIRWRRRRTACGIFAWRRSAKPSN